MTVSISVYQSLMWRSTAPSGGADTEVRLIPVSLPTVWMHLIYAVCALYIKKHFMYTVFLY